MRIVRTKAVRTSRRHQTFLQGALILTAGIFLVKVIGAMFKIPLTWIIGEDGLGYFNTAYHFYSPIHSLATAGFPIAISRMVSSCMAQKRYGDGYRIHQVSIPIFDGEQNTDSPNPAGIQNRQVNRSTAVTPDWRASLFFPA